MATQIFMRIVHPFGTENYGSALFNPTSVSFVYNNLRRHQSVCCISLYDVSSPVNVTGYSLSILTGLYHSTKACLRILTGHFAVDRMIRIIVGFIHLLV